MFEIISFPFLDSVNMEMLSAPRTDFTFVASGFFSWCPIFLRGVKYPIEIQPSLQDFQVASYSYQFLLLGKISHSLLANSFRHLAHLRLHEALEGLGGPSWPSTPGSTAYVEQSPTWGLAAKPKEPPASRARWGFKIWDLLNPRF